MDPITLGIAMAFSTGMAAIGKDILQKAADAAMQPIIEKALDRLLGMFADDAKKEAFAKAVQTAITQALVESNATDMQRMQFENALTRMAFPGQEKLRNQVLAVMLLIAKPDDVEFVAPDLLRALGMQDALRPDLTRFLFYLRRALAQLPDLKPLLEVAHAQNMENAARLELMYLANLSATVTVAQGVPAQRVVVFEADWKPTAYFDALAKEFSRLKLGLFDTRFLQSGQQAVRLDQIYTHLDVQEMVREIEQENTRRMTAIEAVSLKTNARLVLLGAPGSGKSTFVNFLAYCLIQEQLQPGASDGLARLNGWERGALIPVRVVLRELVEWADEKEKTQASADTLWEYIAHATKNLCYEHEFAALKKHLQKHGGIVLLDGLDEVRDADERRSFVKTAIEKFARANTAAHLLVTCRPYAYQNPDWQLEEFHVQTLAPFDETQIQNFARMWHALIGPREGLTDAQIENKIAELLDAIQARAQLQVLAEQPLLLTLMAALNVHGKLPEDRADLYDQTVKLLLDEWQKGKGGGLNPFGIAVETLQGVLAHVAYDAHLRQGLDGARKTDAADITREELRDALAPEFSGSVDRADKLISYMQTRSGLLMPQGQKTYTFPHRSFQEFMAASHALNSPEFPNDLVELVKRDAAWWREVYLFAAGRIQNKQYPSAVNLVNTLWDIGAVPLIETAAEEASKATRVLLAAQAGADIQLAKNASRHESYQRTLEHLQKWLAAVVQTRALQTPQRVEAGMLLGKLGDPRPGVNANDFLFCEIPAGEFTMGSQDDPQAFADEQPQFKYTIPHAYSITRYLITNAQFDAFADDENGYRNDKWWTQKGLKWRGDRKRNQKYGGVFNLSNHPAVGVTWYEAAAFCQWLNDSFRHTDYRIQIWRNGRIEPMERLSSVVCRLPFEAEWEKAARGADGRIYPWNGESNQVHSPTTEHANYAETQINATSAVGAFPLGASPYGVLDLSGNVWEWCSTRWTSNYEDYKPDDDPEGDSTRVVRGGSYYDKARFVRAAYRFNRRPLGIGDFQGFRVVLAPVASVL